MHSAVAGGMSDDAVLNDFRYRERHTDRRHSPATIDAVRSRARNTRIGTDRRSSEPARREPDRLSARCQATDSSRDEYFERHRCRRKAERSGSADAERGADASTDSTERSGCGDHHGRPPFGLELSESSPLRSSGSRRVNTIGTAIRSATPFSELSEIAFPNGVGTVRGSWSRAALRAGCRALVGHRAVDPVPGGGACTVRRRRACGDVRDRHRASRLHGATSADRWRSACSVRGSKRARCGRPRTGWRSTHRAQATPPAPRPHRTRTAPAPAPHRTPARRRPGTEPVPGPRRRTAATASRVPPRPPSARRPRRRSARCPRRSRHRRPRASRCGRRPRAG